jgi:hypothetical protein
MRSRSFALPMGILLVLGLSACGGGGYKTRTLSFSERDFNEDFGFADAPPKTKLGKQGPERLTPGDVLSFRSGLLQGGKPTGEINATCAITHAGTSQDARGQCQGTATVPGGQLVLNVAGAFASGTTRGAIVGGTGDYKGAGGTFTSVESPNGPNKDTFNIQIPQK